MGLQDMGWDEDDLLDAEEKVDQIAEQVFVDGGAMVFDMTKVGAEAIYIDPAGDFGTIKTIQPDGTTTVKRYGED